MPRLKKVVTLILFINCLSLGLFAILNLPVTSKQGVNYEVKIIRIPLYIKIIEFLNRDYHYKELVKRICQGCSSDEDKVLTLFKWTHQNIKTGIPEGWPIIDDHVWNIIIRGYGTDDQSSDVFTTLCTYAGILAFRGWISPDENSQSHIAISYVKLNGRWIIFDPYYKVYFINSDGQLASIEDIIQEPDILKIARNKPDRHGVKYLKYFANLKPIQEPKVLRARQQMPLKRLKYIVTSKMKRIFKFW